VIVCVLLLNVLATVLFSNIVFEKVYINAKEKELLGYASGLQSDFKDMEAVGFVDNLRRKFDMIERNNIDITLFACNENAEYMIAYSTRPQDQPMQDRLDEFSATKMTEDLIASGSLNELTELNDNIIEEVDIIGTPNIRLITFVYEMTEQVSGSTRKTYIVLSTPKEFLSSVADIAKQFVFYISLATLAVAVIVVIIISNRVTKPITNITAIANKIANLDFNEECKVKGKDEISNLAASINAMSVKLQNSIDYLTQRADMLKADLEKEENTNRQKKDFIASVSHDFKTPLSLILAYSEILMDKYKEDQEAKEQLDIISEQSVKMNLLVNQLLTLSQLESGTAKVSSTIFCLNEAISEVLKDCKIMIDQGNISLTFNYQDDYVVKGDYNKILQVITNLLENAIKYCDERKIININVVEMEGHIRTCIYNSHPGIKEESIPLLFDSFYKTDKSRGGNSKSYGLGLSIVKAIEEMHGNRYGVYNSNAGVVFWFELDKDDSE